jgi:hypothetical protein
MTAKSHPAFSHPPTLRMSPSSFRPGPAITFYDSARLLRLLCFGYGGPGSPGVPA